MLTMTDQNKKEILKSIIQDGDVSKCQEQLIFDPFNPKNKEITEKDITTILKRYGVPGKIFNIELYKRAFIHQSYVKRPNIENAENNIKIVENSRYCLPLKTKSNERLEFLGDGILECITKYYLYRRFPKGSEGFMTEKKIALVKNESIGNMAYDMGLNNWYIISKNAEEKKTRTNLKKLGCLFEAFLGALFLDFNKISINDEDDWFKNVFVTGPGFQVAQIFVEKIFETHVNWTDILENDDNYKNILQVTLQKEFKTTPIYREISDYNDNTSYHMGVYLCVGKHHLKFNDSDVLLISEFNTFQKIHDYLAINNEIYVFLGESNHKIKKKAEQSACYNALAEIKTHKNT